MSKGEAPICLGCMSPLGGEKCPRCGQDASAGYDPEYLRPGVKLGSRYLVGRLKKKNGEGALYIGYDNIQKATVWIREYVPNTIARRNRQTGEVLPLDGYGAQYKAQMSDFEDICNEVKRLSVTDSVVPIEAMLRQNNTVYAVYSDLHLIPLEQYLIEHKNRLPIAEAMSLLPPLFSTLGRLHNNGHIHRGISPHTVYISAEGKLYLWDFALGAARTAGCELEAELFNGYAAPEQYSPSGWQGTWTDVYSLAALLYRMVSGVVPPKSTMIRPSRPLPPLEDLLMDVPHSVSLAVAAAMRISPPDRTQTVATFASGLSSQDYTSTAVYDTNKLAEGKERRAERASTKKEAARARLGSAKYIFLALLFTVAVLAGTISIIMTTFFPDLLGSESSDPPTSASSPSSASDSEPGASSEPDADSKVPRFVGQTIRSVRANSEYQQRFDFSVREEYNDTVEEGVIYEQSPLEGTLMPNRGTIILYVSKGPNLVTMPDVVGKTLEQATDILFNMELAFEAIEMYDSTARPGTVIKTSPDAATEFDPAKSSIYVFYMPSQPVIESPSQPDDPDPDDSEDSTDPPFFFHD